MARRTPFVSFEDWLQKAIGTPAQAGHYLAGQLTFDPNDPDDVAETAAERGARLSKVLHNIAKRFDVPL